MKSVVLTLLAVFAGITVLAQPGSEPRRPDTLGGLGNWYNRITRVPVLLNPAQAKTFQPREKLCFDKRVFIKYTGGSRPGELYLYMNTVDGYIGVMIDKDGALGNGDFKPNDEKFRLMVMGRKGNIYTYFNSKKKNSIQHWVTTGNTETHLYQSGFTPGNDAIYKKTVRNMYCGDKFKTWSYKAEGDAPVFHVFGNSYPNKLVCKDFLGYSGVGYLHTDAGIYIVCEMEKGGSSFEMREFEDVTVCFDPAEFKLAEQEMFTEIDEKLDREKEKLDAKTFFGDCAEAKTNLNNFRKALIEKQKRNKQTAQSGNVYQNRNVQKAYANMMDPTDAAQQAIYETDVRICETQKDISTAAAKGHNTSRQQEKLNCYQQQKSRLQAAKSEMQGIDARYPNDLGKAYTEKMKVLGRNMQGCN